MVCIDRFWLGIAVVPLAIVVWAFLNIAVGMAKSARSAGESWKKPPQPPH